MRQSKRGLELEATDRMGKFVAVKTILIARLVYLLLLISDKILRIGLQCFSF